MKRNRHRRLQVEQLENRQLLAFTVVNVDVFGPTLRLVADFNSPINVATVQVGDLQVDGSQPATSFNVIDTDTLEFFLPALGTGTHSAAIAAGAINDSGGTGVDLFSRSFIVASAPQFTIKHNPRLQPGNAPLAGYAGGSLDRVDLLWQTIPGGAGTQDTFAVQYRAVGATAWQSTTLNAVINTGVENRVVQSATITGLSWNANYEYRVRHSQADVIVGQYQSTFRTRLQAGDITPFTFAAYGDSASGAAAGFRQVQGRINQTSSAFSVLLGDNVYDAGTHQESDARFSPTINPEAATWMAGHIDYLGLGNHDIATGSGLPSEQNYSVPVPVAGVSAPAAPPASERGEHNFSWDYGNVHFITFDTNSLSDVTRLDGLLNWVIADLTASTARWKIVYGHHPLAGVPDKPESPSDNYYQQVVNRLKAVGVDLYMTGHSHTYSWTYPLTGQINGLATYVNHGVADQFIAGEGLTQLVSGLGGKEIRSGDYSPFPFVAKGFSSTTLVPARLGFSQVSVTQNQLSVAYVAADNGATIDAFTINKDDTVQTASFQQGTSGYASAVDTFLHQNAPTTNNAAATSLKVDNDDPAGTGSDAQTLLRFDNLFGAGAGQIPTNATIRSARLQLQVTNGSVNNMNLHRMVASWSATDTWNSLVGGVQTNGVEALTAPDTSSGQSQVGSISFNVLSSVQAWLASPTTNKGWAIVPTGGDGVDFHASEGANKPKLIVTYVIPTGPNNPPVAVNDTATTPGNTAVIISVLTNDTDPNSDALSVQSATQPLHGTTVVNAGGTVTYTPANGYFGLDSFGYTISDGRGGTATATVNVTVFQTTSFQQGVNGYAGTIDTYLEQNAPTANNSAATSLNVDGDEPAGTGLDVQALLRFDNLFGNGVGQIPPGATINSAMLQLQVTNLGNSLNLHRMLTNWAATDTWNSLVGGVQNNGVEALAAADVASGAVALGTLSINVLSSLSAWNASPASNLGWVLLPTGTDGVDFDSAEGTIKPRLTVNFVPPPSFQVSSFSSTSTGAVLDFNRDLNPAALNLFDLQGGTLGLADVTLVGATVGDVRGSVVIDSSLRRLTFVATVGVLPPDSYTLTLRSAADGFIDTTTTLLDGDANSTAGGNYVRTFIVSSSPANAVTLSVANFARGPQQSVNIPANGASGLPIAFSNGGGITTATFNLRYNPALLNITAATVAPGLPAGATVSINTGTAGVAVIQFNSPTALVAGTTRFVDLTANVPTTATYRTKHVLDFTNIVLNAGLIPAVDDDALHIAAYFGDTTGNGSYSSTDAAKISRVAVGFDTGFQLYKLLDPTIIGDVSGAGGISSTDTSRMLQAAVGFPIAEIPQLPLPAVSLLQGGPDPKLSIPTNLVAARGSELIVPVNIDSIVNLTGNGLESADLVIYYDPKVLSITSISLGSLVASRGGWMIASRIDAPAGRIFVSLAGNRRLEGYFQGELVQMHALVKATAKPGPSAINLAASASNTAQVTQLNEGYLTLVPAPTNAANDPGVDGLLTILAGPTNRLARDLALLQILASGQRDLVSHAPVSRLLRPTRPGRR